MWRRLRYLPSSTILFTSLPAEIGDGIGYGSRTVTFLYPRRARCKAVEQPQVPPPTIRMEEVWLTADVESMVAIAWHRLEDMDTD